MKLGYKFVLVVLGIFFALAVISLAAFYLRGYNVDFDTKGGTIYASVKIKPGELIEMPPDPVMPGYIFDGWYVNNQKFDPSTIITEDTVLVAHYHEQS